MMCTVTAFKFKKLSLDEKETAVELMFGDLALVGSPGLVPEVQPAMQEFITSLENPLPLYEDDADRLNKEVTALRSLRSMKKREDFMAGSLSPSRKYVGQESSML
jgi:hypothetical protein